MNGLDFFRNSHRLALTALAVFVLLSAAAVSAFAQGGTMTPYQDEKDGVNVGGKWVKFEGEDKMTGAKKVRFELLSDNYFKEDSDYKPRVDLMCSNGKLVAANFNPGSWLAPPNRPGFWGQPQMEVMVRVDDSHSYHGWNWERGRALSMDRGTAREMIGAQIFKVEVRTRQGGREIAEFSPAGLDLQSVKQACDITPKKPSKD